MERRPRNGVATAAGVVAAVLWQVSAEIISRTVAAGSVPPAWLPAGSAFPLITVLDLVPDGGLWLVGMLVSLALVGIGVGLGVRLVTKAGFDGARSFLAIWMVVVLAAAFASALTAPIMAASGGGSGLPSGAYWGLLVGWVIATVVALGSRRARS